MPDMEKIRRLRAEIAEKEAKRDKLLAQLDASLEVMNHWPEVFEHKPVTTRLVGGVIPTGVLIKNDMEERLVPIEDWDKAGPMYQKFLEVCARNPRMIESWKLRKEVAALGART